MIDVNVTRKGFKCGRCGFEWIPRKEGKAPKQCPKCRSAYWNKPRVRRWSVKGNKQPTEKDVKRIAKQLRPQTQIVREELRETREKEHKMTKVVNLRNEKYDVYIGRPNKRYGLKGSKWANPYVVGKDGTRDECIQKYKSWLMANQKLLNDLYELTGQTLGCWCKPKPCHGDILVGMVNDLI